MTTPESVQQANESVATKLLDLLLFGRAPQPTRERFVLRVAPGCPAFMKERACSKSMEAANG